MNWPVMATGDIEFTDQMELKATNMNYYFVLYPYRLTPLSKYYTRDGQDYIEYIVWDSVHDGKRVGHLQEAPMLLKYRKDKSPPTGVYPEKPGSMLVPITRGFYNLINYINIGLFVLLAAAALYFIFILPARILLRISRGDFFHRKNVPALNAIGIFFTTIWFFNSVMPVIMYWIFSGVIPPDFEFPYLKALLDRKYFLVAGLAVFIVAKAFQRGYVLEKELALRPASHL